MPTSKSSSLWSTCLLGLAFVLAAGCPASPPAVIDAGPATRATTADAGPRPRARRGRRRRPRTQTGGPQIAASAPGEAPFAEDEEGPAPPRPRMVETGPVLTEDLGPPPSMELDMTQGTQGPMGLETGQIRRAMDPLLPRMAACAEATADANGHGPRGRVNVRMRVHGDGRPVAARVSGGGGTGEFVICVRRVVASARFDRFAGPDVFATWGFDVD